MDIKDAVIHTTDDLTITIRLIRVPASYGKGYLNTYRIQCYIFNDDGKLEVNYGGDFTYDDTFIHSKPESVLMEVMRKYNEVLKAAREYRDADPR